MLMPLHRQFGKRQSPSKPATAVHHESEDHSGVRGASAWKTRAFVVFAFIAMLVPGTYVWSRFGGDATNQSFGDGSDKRPMSSLSEHFESVIDELGQWLGDPPESRHEPSPEDAAEFANNLQSRFEDVASKLAAASNRKSPTDASAGADPSSTDRSVERHQPSLAEILRMSKDAESQFADINRILGVKPAGKKSQNLIVGIDRLVEALSVDLSSLTPVETEQAIKDTNAQTAAVINEWLPMETGFSGVRLLAIDPAGTALRYSYRFEPNQAELDINQVGMKLRRQVCEHPTTRTIIRHGGHYEFMFYGSDDRIISEITVSASSCP